MGSVKVKKTLGLIFYLKRMEENYLMDIRKLFAYYKALGEGAMQQVSEKDLFWQYDSNSNSIAIIVKHISGNMLSRWTNFLSSDGEKKWRDRDSEFDYDLGSQKELMGVWNKGWDCLFDALDSLQPSDLQKIIYIRNTGHSVSEALNRQLAHYAAHIGQIIFLSKMISKEKWQSLSIPKGASKDFNKVKFSKNTENQHFTDDLTSS
ncbi:DUF1572 family protein [Lutimonas halocynthiae]|uniref:DUF1572 family protein n=1 Tax=Lutimonas halocynthiae TaxID=1446477 RepID=UPI0025B4C692|nr:DUF1572 family protein [Lutimonas halocynthiae]MDN3642474.1 DUF1572 family protein [Lutimonas halocynthiae]